MARCIELAHRGDGRTAPNPLVGCVIVHNGIVISEGWHHYLGGAHAERDAILKVQNDNRLAESTLYVNLEPCAHTGKTPPCANLIVDSGIRTVVYGSSDPNKLVNGKGLEYLRKNGVTVIGPVLESECRKLNKRFEVFHTFQRPFIILKWAQTQDGFIAPHDKRKTQISGFDAQVLLHKWRSEEASVLVGANTAVMDQPQLNVRFWNGNQPLAVFIDPHIKGNYDKRDLPTLVFNTLKDTTQQNTQFVKCENDDFIEEIMLKLWERGINSILVEGGAETLNRFLKAGIWDEIRVIKSNSVKFGNGLAAPQVQFTPNQIIRLENDIVEMYQK